MATSWGSGWGDAGSLMRWLREKFETLYNGGEAFDSSPALGTQGYGTKEHIEQLLVPMLQEAAPLITGSTNYGPSASDPSGTFTAGDTYFNTAMGEPMTYFDGIGWRSTQLYSVTASNAVLASGTLAQMDGTAPSANSIGTPVFKGTLVGLSAYRSNSSPNGDVECIVDWGTPTTVGILNVDSAGLSEDYTLNSDFGAGVMNMGFAGDTSGDMNDAFITAYYRRRA